VYSSSVMESNVENQDNLPWWRKAIARGAGIVAAISMLVFFNKIV